MKGCSNRIRFDFSYIMKRGAYIWFETVNANYKSVREERTLLKSQIYHEICSWITESTNSYFREGALCYIKLIFSLLSSQRNLEKGKATISGIENSDVNQLITSVVGDSCKKIVRKICGTSRFPFSDSFPLPTWVSTDSSPTSNLPCLLSPPSWFHDDNENLKHLSFSFLFFLEEQIP